MLSSTPRAFLNPRRALTNPDRRAATGHRLTKRMTYNYKAFISYSHSADERLAASLEAALEQLACPFYRRRNFNVFRDKTGLHLTPALWPQIKEQLTQSEYFILLASPAAAASVWVRQEIDEWLKLRSIETLLIVQTGGVIAWDAGANDFDWGRTDALPDNLRGKFDHVPLVSKFQWASRASDLSLRDRRFLGDVTPIAARLHGVAPDELAGQDLAQHRRFKRTLFGAIAVLLALLATTSYAAYSAWDVGREAAAERDRALSRGLAARAMLQLEDDPDLSLLLAAEAAEKSRTEQAEQALRSALAGRLSAASFSGETGAGIKHVALSDDWSRAAAVSEDGKLLLWDVKSGQKLAEVGTGERAATGVAFGEGGETLSVAKLHGPNPVSFKVSELLDRKADAGPGTAQARDESPRVLGRSADHRLKLTLDARGAVQVWSAGAPPGAATLTGVDGSMTKVAFSPDNRFVMTYSEYAGGKPGATTTAQVWDAGDGKLRAKLSGVPTSAAIALSTGGDYAVFASADGAQVWGEYSGGKWEKTAELSVPRGPSYVAAFSHDTTFVVTAGIDQTVRVWDRQSGQEVGVLRGHRASVNTAVFSRDDAYLLTGADDATARLWETSSWKIEPSPAPPDVVPRPPTVSHDGERHLELQGGRLLVLSNVGARPLALPENWMDLNGAAVTSAAFSGDGRYVIAGADDRAVRVWDWATETGRRQPVWQKRASEPVSHVSFSGDGKLALVACENGEVIVVDWAEGKEPVRRIWHESVRSMALSPDNQLIAVLDRDGNTTVYELETRRRLLTLPRQYEPIRQVVFGTDGRSLMVVHDKGTADVYECLPCGSLDDLLRVARRRVRRGLTPDESQRYLQ